MPWCKYFIPKIASPDIRPGDPDLNENIEYAKCIKGHVLKSADDWILCENLPAPDAKCWQEGGETVFSLLVKKRREEKADSADEQQLSGSATAQRTRP